MKHFDTFALFFCLGTLFVFLLDGCQDTAQKIHFDAMNGKCDGTSEKIYENTSGEDRIVTVKIRNKTHCEVRIKGTRLVWQKDEKFVRDVKVVHEGVVELECVELDGDLSDTCDCEWMIIGTSTPKPQ